MASLDDEVLRSAQVTARSGAILTIGQILSTFISFITLVFVIRLLGEEQYGLYGLVLVPISMIMLFCTWGVPSALTKYIAWFRAKNRVYEIKKLVTSAFIFVAFIGTTLTIITYVLAKSIAIFYQKPETVSLIRIVSLTLLAVGIYRVSWNIFLGFEDTKYNAAMSVTNAVMKGGLALTLVLLGYGVLGAVLGYIIGYFTSGILGAIFIPRKILKYDHRNVVSQVSSSLGWKDALKLLLGFGFPLAITNIITGFGGQLYNFLAGRYCSKWDFGNYNAANTLLVPLPVLTLPISMVMFPAYSKVDSKGEKTLLDSAFKLAVKYVALLIVPVAALIIGLSEPLKNIIFGQQFPDAPLYLTLSAIIYLYTSIGYLNFGPLLKGQGYTKTIMIGGLIGLIIGIPTSFLLIPKLGIIGLILTNIIAITAMIIYFLIIVKRKLNVSIEWNSSFKILLAGIVTAFTAYFLQMWMNRHPILELLIGGFAGLSIYILVILVTRALTMEDVHNLKIIFGSIRPLKRVLKPHAKRIEEILKKVLE